MNVKNKMVMALFAAIFAAGCNVQDEPVHAETALQKVFDRVSQPWQPSAAACSMDQQDFAGCDACAKQYFPDTVIQDAAAFHHCYNDKANGCLVGDGSKCGTEHPDGALVWLDVVQDVCDNCAAKCCYFCATPWGRMAP